MENIKKALKVPLKFHWSVLLLFGLFVYQSKIMGIFYCALILLSVIVHEYSHVWMCVRQKMKARSVTLNMLGGMASIDSDELMYMHRKGLKISIAGPASSLVLFLISLPLTLITDNALVSYFAFVNLILMAFNILPIFPMDGGRILYHVLAKRIGELKSINIVTIASYICSGIGAAAFAYFGDVWMVVLFGFIAFLAWTQKQAFLQRHYS
jgi:Zn-dependent protease